MKRSKHIPKETFDKLSKDEQKRVLEAEARNKPKTPKKPQTVANYKKS